MLIFAAQFIYFVSFLYIGTTMEEFNELQHDDIMAAVIYHDQLQAKQLPHQVSFDTLTKKYCIKEEDAEKLTNKIMGSITTSLATLEPLIDQYAYQHFSKCISVYDSTTLLAAVKLIEKLNDFSQINLVTNITESLKKNGIEGFNPDLLSIEEENGRLTQLSYHGIPVDLNSEQPLLASSRLLYALNAYYFGNTHNQALIDQVNYDGKYQVHPIHFHSDGHVSSGSAVIEQQLPVHGYGLYERNADGLWDSVQDYEISEFMAKSLLFEVSHTDNDEAFQSLLDRWDYAAISDDAVNEITGQIHNDLS